MIGCVVGIGVPLLIAILVLLYIFCIMPTRTDFIDSDGKVITAYKRNIFVTIWYSLLGKNLDDARNFSSESPMGSDDNSSDFIITNDKDVANTYEVPDIDTTQASANEEDDLINNIRGRNFKAHRHSTSLTSNVYTESSVDEFTTPSQGRQYDHLSIVNSIASENIIPEDFDDGYYHRGGNLNVTNY